MSQLWSHYLFFLEKSCAHRNALQRSATSKLRKIQVHSYAPAIITIYASYLFTLSFIARRIPKLLFSANNSSDWRGRHLCPVSDRQSFITLFARGPFRTICSIPMTKHGVRLPQASNFNGRCRHFHGNKSCGWQLLIKLLSPDSLNLSSHRANLFVFLWYTDNHLNARRSAFTHLSRSISLSTS